MADAPKTQKPSDEDLSKRDRSGKYPPSGYEKDKGGVPPKK